MSIENWSSEELLREFEWIIKRMTSYNASNEEQYKEKLKAEILKRLNS